MQENTSQTDTAVKNSSVTNVTHLPKSANNSSLFDRLMKHAQIEQDTTAAKSTVSWSHLMTFPDKIQESCLTVGIEAAKKVEILNAYGYLDKDTGVSVNNLAKDLDLIGKTAAEIKEKHKSYSGRAKSEAEETAVMGIHSEYMELHDRYQRTIPQSLLAISERVTDLMSDINSGKVTEIKKAAQ